MLRGFALIAAILLVHACVQAGPSDYFSKADSDAVANTLNEHKDKASGQYNGNIGDTHYAVKTLRYLGKKATDTKNLCSLAKDGLSGDIESIYHSVQVIKELECKIKPLPDNVAKVIKQATGGDSLLDYFHAVSSAYALGDSVKLPKETIASAASAIMDLMDDDQGTFKRTPKQDEGSAYYAGLAYTTLALLYKDLGEDEKEQVQSVYDLADTLLSLAEEDVAGTSASFSHQDNTVSSLKTTSTLLQGVLDLSTALGEELAITEELLTQLAQYFINNKHTNSIPEAAALIHGLQNCNGDRVVKPVVLSVARGTVHISAKGEEGYVQLKVSDLFGGPVPAKVYLVSAFSLHDKSKTPILSNQEVLPVKGKSGLYNINFLAAKPDPGAYVVEFRVTPSKDVWQAIEVERTIKIQTQIVLDKPEIIVTDSASAVDGRSHTLEVGKPLKQTVAVTAKQFLNLRFKVRNKASGRSLVVHQAFVKLTNQKTSEEHYFLARPSKTKTYEFKLDVNKQSAEFKNRGGKYTATLIIGDAYIDNSFEWVLGTVSLAFSGESVAETKAAKKVLPEITHKFAEPEERAPRYLSDAFTIAVLAQLLFLLVGFLTVGINFRNFPVGLDTLSALGFHSCLAGWLALYAAYWLYLNMFEAGRYMLVLIPATIFFGHRTLRHIARRSKKRD